MRIFQSFPAALSEIERDLKELGTAVPRASWQGKEAGDRLLVRELQNYQYTVLKPDLDDLTKVNQPWADEEFRERVSTKTINPGEAWRQRREVWEELLEPHAAIHTQAQDPIGKFSYTYNERMSPVPKRQLVDLLVEDPTTRRAFLPIYWAHDLGMALHHRVPCSLGYHFQADRDRLNMTYYMRSCDWTRHFQDDVYLALALRHHIIERYNEAVDDEKGASGDESWKPYFKGGSFTHNIANLHVFEKDVAHVF